MMICFNAEARNAWISTNLIHVLCEAIDAKLISDNRKNNLLTKFRFYSTHDPEELTSLDEYISRMKEDQDTILYLPGDSKAATNKSMNW